MIGPSRKSTDADSTKTQIKAMALLFIIPALAFAVIILLATLLGQDAPRDMRASKSEEVEISDDQKSEVLLMEPVLIEAFVKDLAAPQKTQITIINEMSKGQDSLQKKTFAERQTERRNKARNSSALRFVTAEGPDLNDESFIEKCGQFDHMPKICEAYFNSKLVEEDENRHATF